MFIRIEPIRKFMYIIRDAPEIKMEIYVRAKVHYDTSIGTSNTASNQLIITSKEELQITIEEMKSTIILANRQLVLFVFRIEIYNVTLTTMKFDFASSYCLILIWLSHSFPESLETL